MFLRRHQKYHCVLDDRIKNYSTMQYSLRKVKNHTGPSFLPSSFLYIFLSDLKTDFIPFLFIYFCVYTHTHVHMRQCAHRDLLAEVCFRLSPRGPWVPNSSQLWQLAPSPTEPSHGLLHFSL